jgi:hypothetical protein
MLADGLFGRDTPRMEFLRPTSSIRIGSVTAADETIWADLRDGEAEGLQIGLKVTLSWPPSAAQIWEEGGK